MELGGMFVTYPNSLDSHRAIVENLINYNKLISNTPLLADGWKNDRPTKCNISDPTGENTGVTGRTAGFVRNRVRVYSLDAPG